MKKISLLIPIYNEEESIDSLHAALRPLLDNSHPDMMGAKYDWEVILVNDGSNDSSLNKIKKLNSCDPRFRYVSLSRNFGKENALLAGFDRKTGDDMVIIDADLQHPVATITIMISK